MSPTVGRRHRRILLHASTGALEWWTGAGMMVAGLWLTAFDSLPWQVELHMVPEWMTAPRWGLLLFTMGFTQWWFADTRWSVTRMATATGITSLLAYVSIAYVESGLYPRWTCAFLITLTLAEGWISYRATHDRARLPHGGIDRRIHGD